MNTTSTTAAPSVLVLDAYFNQTATFWLNVSLILALFIFIGVTFTLARFCRTKRFDQASGTIVDKDDVYKSQSDGRQIDALEDEATRRERRRSETSDSLPGFKTIELS